MIKVDEVCEGFVKLRATGEPDEFLADLARIRAIPQEDRMFQRTSWTVRNPEKYTHIQAIKSALDDHKKQLPLF
jgi:hypothetical protein